MLTHSIIFKKYTLICIPSSWYEVFQQKFKHTLFEWTVCFYWENKLTYKILN